MDVAPAPVVAFCDDDDIWFPEKAARQLALLDGPARGGRRGLAGSGSRSTASPSTGRSTQTEVTFTDLLDDRLMEVNFCTAMVRRDAFLDRIGPADEHIPGGYAEDYEWVLRAARSKPIAVVPEPLVIVEWHAQSFFAVAVAGDRRRARLPRRARTPSSSPRRVDWPGSSASARSRWPPSGSAATRGTRSGRRSSRAGASPGPTWPAWWRPGSSGPDPVVKTLNSAAAGI